MAKAPPRALRLSTYVFIIGRMGRRAIFLVCLALLCGCATQRQEAPPAEPSPVVSLESGVAIRPDQFKLILPFVLTVINPRSGSIRLESVDYALFVEGAEAARGSYRKSEEAEAGGSLSVPFELAVDTKGLGDGIYGSGGPPEALWRLETLVRIETSRGAVFELSHAAEGSFAIVREPGFRIRSVTIERDLLVTTKLAVDLEVDNPNVFPIDFSSLSYDFYGEGEIWADGRSDDAATVPARGSVERTLSFTMNFASMDRSLFDLVANLRVVRYRLKGEAKIATGLAYLPEFATRFDSEGDCEVRR